MSCSESRRRPSASVAASDRPVYSGQEALTWPFPETAGSPVWQAWRSARDADRSGLESKGWAAIGLRQVLESTAHLRCVRASRDANEPAQQPHEISESTDSGQQADGARHVEPLGLHFQPALVQRLKRASLETLGDVAMADSSGWRWWAMAPGIGPRRAHEIAKRVRSLLKVSA